MLLKIKNVNKLLFNSVQGGTVSCSLSGLCIVDLLSIEICYSQKAGFEVVEKRRSIFEEIFWRELRASC